jgi:catechol 2,3-dioxygenase-like lactoylglutathione lyase family enzyme
MKFKLPVIVVRDMERSRKFYEELLDLKVVLDFGANVTFDGGLSLQTRDVWRGFIGSEDTIICRPNNFELYFEEKNLDKFLQKLKGFDVEMVHDVKEYTWGQRVVRFYDPDKHIIEVAESMTIVIRRFYNQGMSVEEIVERSQHPVEFVKAALEQKVQKRLVGVKHHD